MIMIWNRKELFVGNAMQRFNEIRYALAANKIDYTYRIVNSATPTMFGVSNQSRNGTFGVNMDYTRTYYLYVNKRDYDKAQGVLHK